MLALYGHPFSSYTWKALIPLYANGTAFEFRTLDGAQVESEAFVSATSPQGKFPVLVDGDQTVFEAVRSSNICISNTPAPRRCSPPTRRRRSRRG